VNADDARGDTDRNRHRRRPRRPGVDWWRAPTVGPQAKLVATVDEFLKVGRPDGTTCLVLDVRLPGRSGLDLQPGLGAANIRLPIIFITGFGTSQYPSGVDPSCDQDALPRDMNRLGGPELVLNPVVARATSSAWDDGGPMCSGATAGGSGFGAASPLAAVSGKDRVPPRPDLQQAVQPVGDVPEGHVLSARAGKVVGIRARQLPFPSPLSSLPGGRDHLVGQCELKGRTPY
jgi:hypothetical protein